MLLRPRQIKIAEIAAVLVSVLSLPSATRAEPAQPCHIPAREEIVRLSDGWVRAVTTGRTDDLAELYAEDATALPMLSQRLRVGRKNIRSYFEEVARRYPQGVVRSRRITTGCSDALEDGSYVFRLTGQRKGTRTTISGSYRTHYALRDGRWLIVDQSSSTTIGSISQARILLRGSMAASVPAVRAP